MGSVLSVPTLSSRTRVDTRRSLPDMCSARLASAPAFPSLFSLSDSPAYGNLYCIRMRHGSTTTVTTAPPTVLLAKINCGLDVRQSASASEQQRPTGTGTQTQRGREGRALVRANWRHINRLSLSAPSPRPRGRPPPGHHAPRKKQQLLVVPWWASDRSLADGCLLHDKKSFQVLHHIFITIINN